ncbi:hypothetical protein D3C84_497770 [compost metagenome]
MSNPEHITESFIGSGKLFVDGRRLGNCSDVKLAYNLEKKTLPNFEGGGGNLNTIDRVTGVTLDLTCTQFSAENLAIALAASITTVASAAVTDEAKIMAKHSMVDTDFMLDMTDAANVVVKTAGASPVTIPKVDNTGAANYEVTPAGIYFKGGADVIDATAIKVDYKKAPHYQIQALLASGREFKLVMDGINDADGRPSVLRVWKWKPSPTDGLSFISDDFSNFTMKGEALADVTKPAGKSQFFELLKFKAAA